MWKIFFFPFLGPCMWLKREEQGRLEKSRQKYHIVGTPSFACVQLDQSNQYTEHTFPQKKLAVHGESFLSEYKREGEEIVVQVPTLLLLSLSSCHHESGSNCRAAIAITSFFSLSEWCLNSPFPPLIIPLLLCSRSRPLHLCVTISFSQLLYACPSG